MTKSVQLKHIHFSVSVNEKPSLYGSKGKKSIFSWIGFGNNRVSLCPDRSKFGGLFENYKIFISK